MKITRYIAIVAIIAAVLAAVAWVLRDNLIQRLSNPLLQDYGIAITDVSLDALAAGDATISHLELRHEKGTSVIIEDLTLPLATSKSRTNTYRARKVSIVTATRADDEVFEMAELIRQFLSLSGTLAHSVVIVDEFTFAPYPTISGVRWEIENTEQQLDGSVQSVGMSLRVAHRDAGAHDVNFLLHDAQAASDGHRLVATLSDDATGLTLTGGGIIHVPTWQPLAQLAGVIPQDLEIASGMADLSVDIEIPTNPSQSPTLTADFSQTSPMQLTYTSDGTDAVAIMVQSAGSAEISATFPEIDWSLTLAEASLLLSYGSWTDVPVAISGVDCNAGTTCGFISRVQMSNTELPAGSISGAALSSAQEVHLSDTGIRVNVEPGALLQIDTLVNEDIAVERVKARLVSAATFETLSSGWRLLADSVDTEVEALSLGENLSVSAPMFLENVASAAEAGRLTLESGIYAPAVRAKWRTQSIALPGLTGRLALAGDDLSADLETIGLATESTIQVRHELSEGAGQAIITDGSLSFTSEKLSDRVSPWQHDGDIVAGTVSFASTANWAGNNSGFRLDARATIAATQLAGYFGETAFSGVTSQLDGTYRDDQGFMIRPSTATADLVEIGVPLERVEADYRLDLNALSADVTRLRMSAFGGVVSADPFSFRTDADANTVTLNTDALDLSQLLSLDQFEALEMTGSVAARLPVTVQGDFFTIADGVLTGNAPGGVIRYRQAFQSGDQDASGLGFAQRVLSNFEYETLVSDVSLGQEGDLILKLKLTGRNPDLDEQRPVVLNVVVENNIPQMLRSLRAARAVEDVLESQMKR